MDPVGKIWLMLENSDPTLENRDLTLKKHRVKLENGTGPETVSYPKPHVWCLCVCVCVYIYIYIKRC